MSAVTFSGLASGIDGDALIKATMESRRVAEVPLQNKQDENDRETTALEEFNSKLLSLRGLLDAFMTMRGGGVERTGKSSNSDAVTISASAGAPITNTDMTVTQLARSASFSFLDRFASYTDPVAPGLTEPGKLTITTGNSVPPKVIEIDVKPGMTLSKLVDEINAKGEGNFHANIVNAGSGSTPQYLLYVNGYKTGEEEGSITVSADDTLVQAGALNQTNMEQARDAIINVQGVGEIRRASNQFSDVIPGATVELKQVTAGMVSLGVSSDAEKTADKVGEFIDAINELSKYSKSKSTVERVEKNGKVSNAYGDLGHTRVDEDLIGQIRSLVSSLRADRSKGSVNSFADLGITTQRDGTYAFDRTKLVSALNNEPDATGSLLSKFSDRVASSSGIISKYTQFQGVIDSSIDSNKESNAAMQAKIDRIERSIEAQVASMRMTFANLEATSSRMQSSGSAISSMIASLSAN